MDDLRYSYGMWQCHKDARALGTMPADPAPATDAGRQMARAALEQARASSSRFMSAGAKRAAILGTTSWRDTPYEVRRTLAAMASLSPSVADKTDRDLTESEKALLREATKRLSAGISGLAASL